MIFKTLQTTRFSLLGIAPKLQAKHNIVRLADGRGWVLVLGAPDNNAKHVRGNVWHQAVST